MKSKDEYKIRRWLGDRYHLNTEVTFLEDKTKIESWKLFRVYPNWMTDGSEPIMTSETHTDKELFEFAKKHRKYDLSIIDNIVFLALSHLNMALLISNFWFMSKEINYFASGINFVIIITCIVKDIFINKNSKVSKLEFKEKIDIFLKKENIKDERKNDTRESN